MATIEKRKNSYRISVSIGYDATGHQIRKTTTYTPKASTPKAIEKEVQKFAYEFEQKVKDGNIESGYNISFQDYASKWLDTYVKANLSPKTQEMYEWYLNKWIYPAIGYLKMTKVKPAHCQAIYNNMQSLGYSASYIKKIHGCISNVFTYAYKMQVVNDIPTKHCFLPTIEKSNNLKCFTLEQTNTFLHALTMEYTFQRSEHISHNGITGNEQNINAHTQTRTIATQFQLYFVVAIASGLRRGEMLALTWNDIEFLDDAIIVHVNKSTTRTIALGQFMKEPKSKSGYRNVTIPNDCKNLFETWYTQEKKLSEQLGTAWKGKTGNDFNDTFIFIQHNGKQMSMHTPYYKMQEIIDNFNKHLDDMISENPSMEQYYEDLKLPHISLHGLRHTNATLSLANNIDIETVAHRLGHARASITLDVYGHALESIDKRASNTLGKLLEIK